MSRDINNTKLSATAAAIQLKQNNGNEEQHTSENQWQGFWIIILNY